MVFNSRFVPVFMLRLSKISGPSIYILKYTVSFLRLCQCHLALIVILIVREANHFYVIYIVVPTQVDKNAR